MTPDQLRAIMEYLRERVRCETETAGTEPTIVFDAPSVADMVQSGLDPEGARQILEAEWWDEMVEDIVDTPAMCDPEDSSQEVLAFAKDVVSEYIRKRASL